MARAFQRAFGRALVTASVCGSIALLGVASVASASESSLIDGLLHADPEVRVEAEQKLRRLTDAQIDDLAADYQALPEPARDLVAGPIEEALVLVKLRQAKREALIRDGYELFVGGIVHPFVPGAYRQWLRRESDHRGFLGIDGPSSDRIYSYETALFDLSNRPRDIADGCVVAGTHVGCVASEYLQAGDLIVSVGLAGGERYSVASFDELVNFIQPLGGGTDVQMIIRRGDTDRLLTLRLDHYVNDEDVDDSLAWAARSAEQIWQELFAGDVEPGESEG